MAEHRQGDEEVLRAEEALRAAAQALLAQIEGTPVPPRMRALALRLQLALQDRQPLTDPPPRG